MCNEFCKELCGWCRAFTRVERALTALQVALLALGVALLAFLALHLLACGEPPPAHPAQPDGAAPRGPTRVSAPPAPRPTLDPTVECTWVPSAKTKAETHYYGSRPTPSTVEHVDLKLEVDVSDSDTDGEEAEDEWKSIVVALVKMRPPNDITFGCILTIIGEFWAVTAASCIEAIEEVDSLDSFVMMEEYGGVQGGAVHAVADLRVHPFYRGTNGSYDVAALRSADSLTRGPKAPAAPLPALPYALFTLGERFHLLGYGAYRSMEGGARGRRLRAAHVYRLPARECAGAGAGEGGALRHLAGGRAAGAARPVGAALCAGPVAARGLPCNYCGGAPLVLPRGAGAGGGGGVALLALMQENVQCGLTCDPQLYTPLTLVAGWIQELIQQ